MAHVQKCDSCGALTTPQNPVANRAYGTTIGDSSDISIHIKFPSKWQHSDLCQQCVAGIIRSRFAEICGLLAPYQPGRVAGFVQDVVPEEGLTKQEKQALSILSRRLLSGS
jgi:hypothetical protein